MVATNGRMTTRQLLEQIEQHDREVEVERRVEERLAEERARDAAERERQAELRMAGVRRSQLTPKQKSEIIRARGKPFYDSLDW
jgi:hypothetical protein